ncbi:unnamed protein product [Candida verbasci]|uniref:K Homology domain-containing protein n=1 Tax=Candida verbasci TaxID=1227364 RepID=A0A9W4TW85_9ASCO|nr:unnamed protein product [Candida verbasci]
MFTTFNLEYTYLIDPKLLNNQIITYFETNKLWTLQSSNKLNYKIIDNFEKLQSIFNEINTNYANSIKLQITNKSINVRIEGSSSFINNSKLQILKQFNVVNFKTLYISNAEFMKINELFTSELAKLSSRFNVDIIINNSKMNSSSILDNFYAVHILGNQDNINKCELELRILIDYYLNDFYIDCFNVELSMIPILGGIDLFNFNQISKQTKCNIYIPDLLSNIYNSRIVKNTKYCQIWFTSKHLTDILLIKHIISKLFEIKHELIIKEVTVTEKLELIILNNQKDIMNLMFKYGVFIQLPNLGDTESSIIVQGCSQDLIDDCINELILLTTQYYKLEGMGTVCENSIVGKSCILSQDGDRVQIIGSREDIKFLISSNSIILSNPKLTLELGQDQKDFISGKKNGKIMKILNQLHNVPSIKFKPFNEFNFNIILESCSNNIVLYNLLELIELELPSELKFNIPEVFHKSIIGNGGSIIQSIMKKYNVFIKFESERKHNKITNISFKRNNNVLIKCPMKNSKNINLVKCEIDQLVYKCCMSQITNGITTIYSSIKFQLLKSHYLMLINNNKLNLIYRIEDDYSTFINFPTNLNEFNDKNDLIIDIKGSESKIKYCAKQLKNILPLNYEFKITINQLKFKQLFELNKQKFIDTIIIPFKIIFGIEVLINEVPINQNNSSSQDLNYHQIIISYFKEENNYLNIAIDSLTHFLRDNGFLIYEKGEIEFNPLIEPTISSSPVKINNQTFTSPMPLRSITNFVELNNLSPNKNKIIQQTSPVKLSPIKMMNLMQGQATPNKQQQQQQQSYNMYQSPTKQQLYMSSPTKYNNLQSPIKKKQLLSPVKLNLSQVYNI